VVSIHETRRVWLKFPKARTVDILMAMHIVLMHKSTTRFFGIPGLHMHYPRPTHFLARKRHLIMNACLLLENLQTLTALLVPTKRE
jgi:hypothetical protein